MTSPTFRRRGQIGQTANGMQVSISPEFARFLDQATFMVDGKAAEAHTHRADDINDASITGKALLRAVDEETGRTVLSVESTAQLDARDTASRARANHTGTQAWSTITATPTTLAGYGIADAATSAQGALADTAVQPGALSSVATGGTELVIADDDLGAIALPTAAGFVAVIQASAPSATVSGFFAYTAARLVTLAVGSPDDVDNRDNATLTGTTGNDGDMVLAVNAGSLAIENRTGATRTFRVMFF